MSDEIESPPSETLLAEVGSRPPGLGAPAEQPSADRGTVSGLTVERERVVREPVAIATLPMPEARALWEQRREAWLADPMLGRDERWLQEYYALASRLEGGNVEADLAQLARAGRDGRLPAPDSAPRFIELDLAGWRTRLGPEGGAEGDIEVPEGYTWQPERLNRLQQIADRYHFKPQHVDLAAALSRALVSRAWTVEQGLAQLDADYGQATTKQMRADAGMMFDLLEMWAEKDRELRAELDALEDAGLHEHPGAVTALAELFADTKGDPAFQDAWIQRALRQRARDMAAAQTAAAAAARAQAREDQERTERQRAIEREIVSNHRRTRQGA